MAFLLIFVQLRSSRRIALFFSTFASPMLSAALTFGLYVIGHFNADLKNFEAIVPSTAVAWVARVALLPAAEPRAVRHQGPGRARRAGRRPATSPVTLAYAALYVAVLLVAACAIFAGGT